MRGFIMNKKQLEKIMKEKSFPKRIKMPWVPETYTYANLVNAFVQGYRYGFEASDGVVVFDILDEISAETKAIELLRQGRLGKEGE
jgi:hypothetical protein